VAGDEVGVGKMTGAWRHLEGGKESLRAQISLGQKPLAHTHSCDAGAFLSTSRHLSWKTGRGEYGGGGEGVMLLSSNLQITLRKFQTNNLLEELSHHYSLGNWYTKKKGKASQEEEWSSKNKESLGRGKKAMKGGFSQ